MHVFMCDRETSPKRPPLTALFVSACLKSSLIVSPIHLVATDVLRKKEELLRTMEKLLLRLVVTVLSFGLSLAWTSTQNILPRRQPMVGMSSATTTAAEATDIAQILMDTQPLPKLLVFDLDGVYAKGQSVAEES